MIYLFTSALRDFARFRRLLVWVVAVLFISAMCWRVGGQIDGLSTAQKYGFFSSLFTFRITGLLAAVFSTAVLSQEIEQKTIVYLLTRPISRIHLLVARWLAAGVVVFGLSAFCAAMMAQATGIGFGTAFWLDLKALAVGSFTYSALFVLVSLLINRAMTVCLLYSFGWELLSANMPGNLHYTSIYSYMTSLAQHTPIETDEKGLAILAGQLGSNVSPTTALIICGLMTAFLVGVSSWWFSENEFLPREDAE